MGESPVGVFWDFENVRPPKKSLSGYDIVKKIRRFIEPFGPVSEFMAYFDVRLEGNTNLQQELQNSGITLIHTPHNSKKEVVDRKMIVDIMLFALGTPTLKNIVLITGDSDFSDAISKLRLKGHKICVVHPGNPPSGRPPPSLAHVAHTIVNWRTDILEYSDFAACAASEAKTTGNGKVSDTVLKSEPETHPIIPSPVSADDEHSSLDSDMGETIIFKALIHVLETMGASSEHVRQTLVRRALVKRDPKAFKRLGLSSDTYFNKAFNLGIIEKSFGNTKETKNKPFVSLVPMRRTLHSSSTIPLQRPLILATSPVTSTSISTHNSALMSCFGILIEVLKRLNTSAAGASIKQSTVGAKLLDRDPSFFSRMELSTRSYLLLAETAGIISFVAVRKNGTRKLKGTKKNVILRPEYHS